MNDSVTYITYNDNNKVIIKRDDTGCFSDTFSKSFKYINLKITTIDQTKGMTLKWLKLLQKIEPTLEIISKKEIRLPYLGSKGKTLIILSLVRYLWSNYWETIPFSFKIIKKIKDIDLFSAITLAASSTTQGSGWGHSIVYGAAEYIPELKHYKEHNDSRIFSLFKNEYSNQEVNLHIRRKMKNNLDIEPVLKHYNYE